MQTSIPKWVVIALGILVALAVGFSFFVNARRLRNEKTAREMLDKGQLQLKLADTEIAKIGQMVAQTLKG